MVKKTLKNLLLQNQISFGAESCYIMSTKFVQIMTVSGRTFLRQGQICVPLHLYGKNFEKSECIKD